MHATGVSTVPQCVWWWWWIYPIEPAQRDLLKRSMGMKVTVQHRAAVDLLSSSFYPLKLIIVLGFTASIMMMWWDKQQHHEHLDIQTNFYFLPLS
jgi:hypothetical protein